jgi:hypothetical protein
MGYKLLGFAVWQASKWYLRRRMPSARRKMGIVVLMGAIMAVVLAAGRRPAHSH